MTKPLITYVIPCYNCETTIYECVMSIKESDDIVRVQKEKKEPLWPMIEVILVNDGSTDSTIDIINALAEENDNIKVIDLLRNRGKGYARNLGNKTAQADIIAVLDSDDWNINDRTGEILKFLKDTDRDIFYSSFISKHTYSGHEEKKMAGRIDKVRLKEIGLFNICHSSVAYTKKAILDLPYSNDRDKDDWDMLWQFYNSDYKFAYSTRYLVGYRVRAEAIIKSAEEGKKERLLSKRLKKMGDTKK